MSSDHPTISSSTSIEANVAIRVQEAHVYVTSYTGFFNADPGNTQCDDVTFWYWRPGKSGDHVENRVYLDVNVRSELNDLVNQLNTMLSSSVSQVIADTNTARIHFIDISPQFDGHRWCEPNIQEPDSDTAQTWFFLSAWIDRPPPPADDPDELSAQDAADLAVIQANGNQINIPNPSICEASLGDNPDLWDQWLCKVVAQDIAQNSTGLWATEVQLANAALTNGDFTSQEVGFFMPTRQIKTFHPRTWGHSGIRSLILTAMQANGQYSLAVPDPLSPGDVGNDD